MNSFLLSNQGSSNNYKSFSSFHKKIENSYLSHKTSSVMSCATDNENMYSYEGEYYSCDEQEYDGEFDLYSEAELDDVKEFDGDRTDERTKDQVYDDMYDDEKKIQDSRLQNPDIMTYIRPARVLPSKAEQDAWFQSVIDGEVYAMKTAQVVPLIENWWKKCLIKKERAREAERMSFMVNELVKWNSLRRGRYGIKCSRSSSSIF